MIGFLILAQVAVVADGTAYRPPARIAVPLAERPRGTIVTDPAGAPFGVVDASSVSMTTIAVGSRKVQVPANAVYRNGSRVTVAMTTQQLDELMATAAKWQLTYRSEPKPTPPPKGFVEPPRISAGASASSVPDAK